ncbi:MAG: host attachment protein [Caulobacteraceae bacterium]
MLQPVRITWVVVANGERTRVLEQRRRGAPLCELPAWERQQTDEDRRHAHHEKSVESQRFGFGRPTINRRDVVDEAERRFLARFARQLRLARAHRRYEGLILIAPPRALGALKAALGRSFARCIECAEAHDRTASSAEVLRKRVRDLRTPPSTGRP